MSKFAVSVDLGGTNLRIAAVDSMGKTLERMGPSAEKDPRRLALLTSIAQNKGAAPLVQASEIALVFLLAAHLTGGLRLLFVEFVGWRSEAQKMLIASAGGVAAFCALVFALNLL